MKTALIHISELVTCSGGPKAGSEMNQIHIIENGAMVIEEGIIILVGTTQEILLQENTYKEIIDLQNKAVLPGFVDSHTHFIFGGYRAKEFSWRLQGQSYMEIMNQGGGIASTVKATRQASYTELMKSGESRLDAMLTMGVTTVEGKSGYGLDLDTELKQLKVMKELNTKHPVDIASTFLGPHSVLPEYRGKQREFIDYMLEKVMPEVKNQELAEFADIFCEKNVFSIEDSSYYLSQAKKMGFLLKVHADEMYTLGGAEMAAELEAVSADHLLKISEQGIADLSRKKISATLLPCTAFSLKEEYAKARKMIDAGCQVALATDFNPGSSFTYSIPLLISLACIYMDMSIQEVITALTINGAAAIGREKTVGSIEVGKKADFIILEYPSIDFLPYHAGINIVEQVYKDGIKVYEKLENILKGVANAD